MASRLVKRLKDLIFLATQSGFMQYNVSTSFSLRIRASRPHTGHLSGITRLPLLVRFSAIWGMIILALYTLMVSPIPSCNSFTILILCTLARLTVVPSSSTGSKIATGLISPVLDGLHSISTSLVSRISSAHLKAKEFRGNFAVLPRDSP